MRTDDGKIERKTLSMCEFCRKWHDENTICGANIKIYKCANETNLTNAQIMMNTGDKVPGIVIYSNHCMAKGYFDIAFCPMCGRKLVEE
jgi:hypothetical protein